MTYRVVVVKDLRAQVRRGGEDALHRALDDVAEDCLTQANKTVPLETGVLQSSGVARGDGEVWEVFYTAPYAVVQHEDESLRHDPGRRARWLALTVEENDDRWERYIALMIAEELRW